MTRLWISAIFVALISVGARAEIFATFKTGPQITQEIRESPSDSAKMVLSGPSVFLLGSCKGDWCKVKVLVSKKMTSGWVKKDSFRIVSSTVDSFSPQYLAEPKCDYYRANPILTTKLERFKCKEDLFGEQFDRCDAEVSYSIQATCELTPLNSITLNCDLTAEAMEKDGFLPSRKSTSERKYISMIGLFDRGTMDMSMTVSSLLGKTVKVRPKDLDCNISGY